MDIFHQSWKNVGRMLSLFWNKVGRKISYISLIGFMINNYYQCSQNNQYKEQLTPEIDCGYQYSASNERYKFTVHNIGLIGCKDIWAQEDIFLIIDNNVYEGTDVPHLSYFVFQGSRNRMWDLERSGKVEVDIAELQILAFQELKKRFNPVVVSKWKIEFSKPAAEKRYSLERYFVYDFDDRNFKDPKDYVGGESCIGKIRDYMASGSRRKVEIFELTGTFGINPSNSFIITEDYTFIPLYPGKRISLETLNSIVLYSPGAFEIQPSDDIKGGTLRYGWTLDTTRWRKLAMMIGGSEKNLEHYSKPVNLADPISYLSPKDTQRVQKNPGLLKHPSGELKLTVWLNYQVRGYVEYFQILDKAREKYLKNGDVH